MSNLKEICITAMTTNTVENFEKPFVVSAYKENAFLILRTVDLLFRVQLIYSFITTQYLILVFLNDNPV